MAGRAQNNRKDALDLAPLTYALALPLTTNN